MGSIARQAKTLSGMIVSMILLLIAVFFILNLWQTRGGPVAGIGGWLFQRASGEAYSGGGSAMTANSNPATSAYSLNNNLGPAL